MVLGFLGKGGSGKSTISTLTTKALIKSGYEVLAIDADHNQDLTFNLVNEESENLKTFGQSMNEIVEHIGDSNIKYDQLVVNSNEQPFQFNPDDSYTSKYINKLNDKQNK